MKTTTEKLLAELKNTKDIQKFLNEHENEFISETHVTFLNYMLTEKNTTIAKLAKESGVGEYLYKIFSNTRNPSRESMIAVGLALQLSVEEIQLLLRISKFALLDSRDKRDSIIIFGFSNHLSVFEVDDLLNQNNFITIN